MNNAYLSLEQEFSLRLLSIQVHQNNDVAKLQDDLINIFEIVLIKHQNLKDLYSITSKTVVSELEAEANIFYSCIDSIKSNFNIGELQDLLIKANEISMMQKNHSYSPVHDLNQIF